MEHINTFEKGMTKDTSVLLQPDGTYRHMVNCSLVSQDGNNYVIKDCLGNLLTFSVNIPYNAVYTVTGTIPMPIGFISFPDKLIVFSTNNETTGGYGEIGIIKTLPYGEGIQPLEEVGQYNAGYTPLYHHASLLFTKKQRIEGFGFTENELVERIYWTDNFNNPRVFNVSDPVYTNYFATGSLVTGDQYMVLEGAVTHNGVNYGPGLTAGNVFTAANANYTSLTGGTPIPKVIAYYPYQLLDFTPSRALGNIQFAEYGVGSVYCGNKMYFYRLGTDQGVYTSWSYGSYQVPVGKENTPYDTTAYPYHDWAGAGTTSALVDSEHSVKVKIENVDTNFDFIQLACAEFDQSIDVPRQVGIVEQTDITGSTMTLEHTGLKFLGELTLDGLLLFPASIIKCKTIATSKNYNLIGNITEREELDIDVSGTTITSFEYPMTATTNPIVCNGGGVIYDPLSPASGVNPGVAEIYADSRWLVTSVAGGPVEYPTGSGTFYGLGEVITGDNLASLVNIPGGSQIRPCVTKNRYTTTGGDRVENAIELKGDSCFWDYKSAAAHHHVAGYWSNETYRFGVMFYDKKGNPYYVRHIGDYQMPDVNDKGGLIIDHTATVDIYSLNPSLIKVSGLTIPGSLIDSISGFSIVRAERDARIVTQGLVTQCVTDGGSPATYRPGAYVPINKDADGVMVNTYSYLCPDALVSAPLKSSIGVNGDTMESACWLDAYNFSGTQYTRADGGEQQIITKFLTPLSADLTLRTGTIDYFNYVNEGESLTDLGSGITFSNNIRIGSAGTAPVDLCLSTGPYTLDTHKGAGCKKIVFQLESDFLHYNSALDYTSNAAGATSKSQKVLMNYVKSGFSNPYGGTGPQSLATTTYISTGHYQPITTQVKADTLVGSDYVFNDIEVGGGDCFTCLIDIGYGLWDNAHSPSTYSYDWQFPCECNTNYNLRKGRKPSNVGMFHVDSGDGAAGAESIVYDPSTGDPRLEDYSYNQAYSSEGLLAAYPALPVNFVNANQFKFRVRFAGEKFIGETIDSFRTFGTFDFKDLDGQGGEINNIKVKDGRVIVWQNKITSTVPILERQVLGAPDGAATTIGTGGVVDRFDPLNSFFGNQHQWSLIETEFGFAWFDMRRKAFMILNINGGIIEESQVMGLKSFFDEVFVENIGGGSTTMNASPFLNSPTYDPTSDQPLMGVGIHGVYDPKFKMTYMTFKFKARKSVNFGGVKDGYWSKDFTIGYLQSNTTRCFVGFYDTFPAICHNHNQFVLAVNDPKCTTQYYTPSSIANLVFTVGETIPFNNKEYICIADVTLDNVAKYPEGASSASYWSLINQTNNIFVHNQPSALGQTTAPDYLYNKFFNRVVNNEVQFVVNPKTPEPFNVQSIQQSTPTNVNYTDIYIESGSQTASDRNIKNWNRHYEYIWDMLCSSLPLSSTGRIVGRYLTMRFVKKNYDSNPTTLIERIKILQFVKSVFVLKR